ncbi:hypothetical protein [Paenibacillus pabuli]|uniref:hypothetical protein n=1 Tax=Paenibacillus pabuli TaxID=1472 RepID=UPI0020002FAB|nr:hypothetical protein [Paenibacillus pabuli]UPK44909.1 hypothetical protein KET34_05215 [Paenibacillus pabuli]
MASAFVLVEEGSNIPIERLIRDIQEACLEAKLTLVFGIEDMDSEQNMKHCSLGIILSDQEELGHNEQRNNIRVDVYNEPVQYQYRELEWRDDGRVYFNTLIIDEVYQNEEVTLTFLYHFLARHPQTVVWMEEDWVYTLTDLEKALKTSNLSDWCYVNPDSL